MNARKPGAPRPAASYRANGRTPQPLPVIALARPPKFGKAWPNPQNPVQGQRECARRVQQREAALNREWVTGPAVGREMI